MKNVAIEAPEIFEQASDEMLIEIIRKGNSYCQDVLINKYKRLVKMKACMYFISGSDRDDIVQEGMIGLFKAIRDYSADKQVSFYYFADICITRQIFTAIKTAGRKKHAPLNSYISLNTPVDDDNSHTICDINPLQEKSLNPEEILIAREERNYMQKKISESLSPFEAEVLHFYLREMSYAEIAAITCKSVKSVDNAIQRIKGKVERFVNDKMKSSL